MYVVLLCYQQSEHTLEVNSFYSTFATKKSQRPKYVETLCIDLNDPFLFVYYRWIFCTDSN